MLHHLYRIEAYLGWQVIPAGRILRMERYSERKGAKARRALRVKECFEWKDII